MNRISWTFEIITRGLTFILLECHKNRGEREE